MPLAASPSADARNAQATPGPELRRIAAGFGALVAITVCLIVLGALVRAHQAGLACPDWPFCFGQLVPEMNLRVAFEYSHRVLAGSVALCFVALSAACWRRAGRVARRLILVAAALLALQILLGALTVWHLLAAWTVTSHLVTGNLFALTLLLLAGSLRESAGRPAATRSARGWLAAVAALLFVQVVLGGLVSSRYAGMACPEWPTCNGGIWFPLWRGTVGLHLLHRSNGYLLILALAAAAVALRRDPRLAGWTRLALGIGLAQVVVGIANVRLGIPVEITALHSLLATSLVLTLGWSLREAFAMQR
jgi:cytochrome c oxidase assembly protein subunit 15